MRNKTWGVLLTIGTILLIHRTGAAENFFNAPFSMHADFGIGAAFGPATFEERDMFEVTVIYDNGDELDGKPIHSGFRMGPRFDITPFRRKNKKFGFRLGYDYGGIHQTVSVGDDYHESEYWHGWLAKRHNVLLGPIFVWGKLRAMQRALFGTLFVLTGPNIGGKLMPAPGAKDFGEIGASEYNSTFGGWRVDVGAGVGITQENFLFGLNVAWTGNIIAMNEKVYLNVSQTTLINEINFSGYIGVYIP